MTNNDDRLGCSIETTPVWADWHGRDAVVAALRDTLARWGAEWQLALRPTPCWSAAPRDRWPGDTVVRLRVDGHDKGVFVRLPAAQEASPQAVAALLAEAAIANRRAWLTAAAVGRPDLDAADLALLHEAAARGFAPARLNQAPSADGTNVEERCDALVDAEALRWRLQLRDPARIEGQPGDDLRWSAAVDMMNEGLFLESGQLLPGVEVESDATLADDQVRIWVNDLPLPVQQALLPGQLMVNDRPEGLQHIGLTGHLIINPANGNECSVLDNAAEVLSRVKAAGLTFWGPAGYLVLVLVGVARRHAAAFWTATATDAVLDNLGWNFPVLERAWRARFAPPLLSAVLRRLLDERVAVRDLRTVLEAMLALQAVVPAPSDQIVFAPPHGQVMVCDGRRKAPPALPADLDADDWAAQVRIAFARQLSHQHTRGQSTLQVYLLDRALETRLSDEADSFAGVDEHARLFTAVDAVLGAPTPGHSAVILTTKAARATLRRALAADLPELVVLSYEELAPELNIQPLARIDWAG